MNKLVIFDGNALIHRAYHAIPYLTTRDGKQVNAVYGFTSALLKVLQDLKPAYAAVTFDLAGPTFRHKQYDKYKATRVKADQELYDQIPLVKEVVKTFNIPIFEKEGFEADDMIGTLCAEIKNQKSNIKSNVETIIVTGDLDTLQLIDKIVKVYFISKGISQAVIYDEKKVLERYGINPEQMVDFKALKGDASDNIPGVTGMGEKTAADLIIEFGNLENIYANLDKISEKRRNLLTEQKEQAYLSQKLVKIATDAPTDFSLSKARLHDYNKQKLIDLLEKLEFKSLIKRLPEEKREEAQQKLF